METASLPLKTRTALFNIPTDVLLQAFQVQYANNNHLPDLAYYVPRPLPSASKMKGESETSGSSVTTTGSARLGSFVSRFKGGLRKSSGGKPVGESRDGYANGKLVE